METDHEKKYREYRKDHSYNSRGGHSFTCVYWAAITLGTSGHSASLDRNYWLVSSISSAWN